MAYRMTKEKARYILDLCSVPEGADFHTLSSDQVEELADEGRAFKYKAPKNANGSYGRMFYAYICRTLTRRELLHIVQGYTAEGWEDLHAEASYKLASAVYRDYVKNSPGSYRIIKRYELAE